MRPHSIAVAPEQDGPVARLAYFRVSTSDQSIEGQRQALGGRFEKEFIDEAVSGATPTAMRPGFAALLNYAREGDTVVVTAVDVDTVLVNSFGEAWSGDGFGNQVIRYRAEAGIVHDDGRKKYRHDCRGTYATKLTLARLTDEEAAGILTWSKERAGNIRKVYVDQARVVVALAERIAAAGCQPVWSGP